MQRMVVLNTGTCQTTDKRVEMGVNKGANIQQQVKTGKDE